MSGGLLKTAAFGVAVIAAYTAYSVWGVPPMTPEPPPTEAVEEAALTVEGLVAIGEKVYGGKGACALCHDAAGGRAPSLDNSYAAAEERLKDKGYKGRAATPVEYILESLVEPSAYVVKGYGVTGTSDALSPMPDVRSGEIGLTGIETRAVVAYLLSLSGADVEAILPALEEGGAKR